MNCAKLIVTSTQLKNQYPGLKVAAWCADVMRADLVELPPLGETAHSWPAPLKRACEMTTFFRTTGTKGRSPVEFQIRKALDGTLDYSKRSGLVDLLLYAEVATGFIMGLHDLSACQLPVQLATGRDAAERRYRHISDSEIEVRDDEPVLLTASVIMASVTRGPDRATRVTKRTERVLGLMFGTGSDAHGELDDAAQWTAEEGTRLGLWTVTQRQGSH